METSLSRQQTMEYLRIASELETSVYAQESFLKKLREKHTEAEAGRCKVAAMEIPEASKYEKQNFAIRFIWNFFCLELIAFVSIDPHSFLTVLWGIVFAIGLSSGIVLLIAAIIYVVISEFQIAFVGDQSMQMVVSLQIALVLTHLLPGIIAALRTGIVNRNNRETAEYEQEDQKKALAKRKQGIAEWQGKEREIEKWIKSAEASLAETKEDLRKLYALDVIYPKYRNFIAACTIYEYFKSGRCYTLTGHEGAYNLYESELKQNIIISMLQDISTQMNKIIQNQYVLWQAIEDTNDRISGLSSKVDSSVAKLSAEVESAKYSAQLAEQNTNYLVYLESVKNF